MLIVRTFALGIVTVHVSIAVQVISYEDLDPDPSFLFNSDPESDRTETQFFFLKWRHFIRVFLSSSKASP